MTDQTQSTDGVSSPSTASAAASPAAASPAPGMPALPSLNPADSPYQALSLPEVSTPAQHPMPEQDPIQNLGAVSKAGAIAFIANNVLRGATQGYDAARIQHAKQFNKKISALGSLEQQLGQQYQDAYNEAGSTPGSDGNLPSPQQILEDPKVKQLHNQLLAVHQTTISAINSYLPPLTTDKKTGKQKEKRNILERMFGQEPDESLRAYSEVASQLGPTAFYRVKSPQQLKADYEARQGKAGEQTAATSAAELETKKSQLSAELLDAESKGDTARAERAKKALSDLQEALSPYRRPTSDELRRQDYQTLLASGQIPKDANGNVLPYEAWVASQSTAGHVAGAPPKVMKYDNNSGTVADPATGRVYSPTDLDLPLEAASIFKAADNQAFKKQQRSLQQIAARGNAYLLGRAVQVADPTHPGSVIYMRALDAIKQGVPTPSSIWYKLEMPTGQERARADLAISAREQLNTMDQIVTHRPDLFGPEAGRKTDFTKWIGSQDPDAQRFAAAARIAADHLAGVFGGRSKDALEGIYNAMAQNKTNPAAMIAAMEQMNVAAAAIQGRGQGAAAPAPGAGAGAAGPVAPKTTEPNPPPTTVTPTAPRRTPSAAAPPPAASGFNWDAHPVAQ